MERIKHHKISLLDFIRQFGGENKFSSSLCFFAISLAYSFNAASLAFLC